MTCTVAVTNGVGTQTGKLFAFDAVSTIALTGLATAYNSVPCTGYVTSQDGKTALAALATGTPAAAALSLAFDFRTSPCRALFTAGNTSEQTVRLRVMVTATGQVVADALLAMVPGPEAGTTTTSTGGAAATLAQAQALVDAHAAGALHVASTVETAVPDGSDRFELWAGALLERTYATWNALKSAMKSYMDTLYEAAGEVLAHAGQTSSVHGITAAAANVLDDETVAAMRATLGAEAAQTAASQAEMEAGTESAIRSMSPLRVAQALAKQALTPAELTPSVGSPYAVDYAAARQVQDLGTVSTALTLTKGTGWPASGSFAYVLLKLVISGSPTITWTVAGQWTTDAPSAAGTYYVHLRQIAGTIVASAEEVQT